MKEEKSIEEIKDEDEAKEDKISSKKAGVIIFMIVILAFILLLCFTDTIGSVFGKKAENIALIIIGICLGLYLYKLNRSK